MNRTKHRSQDEVKKIRRGAYIKIVAAVGFIAAVLAYGTISWFTMNKENNASGMGVRTKTIDFELMSKGNISLDAAYTAATEVVDGQSVTEFHDGILDNLFYRTDTNHQKTKWRLQLETAEELEPGTEGVLEFWVKPKGTSSIDLDFTLSMRGFSENTNANPVWSECTNVDAVNYLNGHILFFKERVPHVIAAAEEGGEATTEYSYKGLINPSYPKSNITVNEPVEIYWVWADTALQLVSVYDANGVKGIADNTATLTEIQSYLASNQDAVFAVNNDYTSSSISTALNTWWSESATEAAKTDAVNILGKCYNRADSMIGSDIQGALVVLNAEP